jgi:DNA-binding HxlR family transcriptional regulator
MTDRTAITVDDATRTDPTRTDPTRTDPTRTDPTRTDPTWTDPTCPVARTLDVVGDRWMLLIIRDAMDGARAFTDFQQRTGIARNILTDRLTRLVDRGILERRTAPSGKRQVYTLTPTGRDLFTVIVALRQWGERHVFAPDEPHSVLVDELGVPLPHLEPLSSDGTVADAGRTRVLKPGVG